MSKFKLLTAGLLAGSIVLTPALAAAACTQADLEGPSWKFQTVTGGAAVSCIVTVNATGKITKDGKCTYTTNSTINIGVGAGSKVTMSTPGSCVFTGTLIITAGGDSATLPLTDGALAMDHGQATGISLSGTNVGFFTMTRL